MKKASALLLVLWLCPLVIPAATAQELPPGTVPLGPYDPLPEDLSQLEETEVLMGEHVPTYFVVTAFLRRAALVLERPPADRPDFFAEFGCAPGAKTYESCQELVKKAAAVHLRESGSEDPEVTQATLDQKGREIGQFYAQLLELLTKNFEGAASFHRKVEEVRITVGVGLSDEPGQDLLRAARLFDQSFKAGFPEAARLPGYVVAPAAQAPEESAKKDG